MTTEREEALGEAIRAVHVRRFDRDRGEVGGPDTFYAGVQAARRALYALLPEGAVDPLATTGRLLPPRNSV
jgi:hypothetical protein